MFTNYDNLYARFCEYLRTECGQLNISDMEDGFANISTFIAHLYGSNMPYAYKAKFSEAKHQIVFCESSVEEQEEIKDLNLKPLLEYSYTEYAYVDSCRKMKHCVYIGSEAYLLTDYGIVKISTGEHSNDIRKITSIKMWINDNLNKKEICDFLLNNLVEIPNDKKLKSITVCTQGSYGIKTTDIEIKPFDCDIKKNYNDDLPFDRINKLINSDEQELILLHGEPGTGKTSIIKKLMNDNIAVDFLYFDFNLLTSFSDSKIFDFLMEHKNHVFIIEDCEKLFTDRNSGNQYLNTMLNLTDGIIGEAFKIKFICTFNCPPSKIDKAVLREGRLSLIYEFKKLSLNKTKELLPTATEPMTLAQIYNTEDNGNKKDKKIGF